MKFEQLAKSLCGIYSSLEYNNSVVMEVIIYRAEDPAKYYGADEDVIEFQITNK